jgi:DNA invertase Pin-like site-specific DNA recombinase
MTSTKQRCAIYTRKSTEEGLDQAFNSLDAQREACEAYIASQAGLGWQLIPALYDDGGISGGHMDRPALQRLLGDIERGQVDVVVVYKIDRLTRSLMDFAKMVAVFDKHVVSFVSVTQQFNTTTSMGRLTLNVLLSFAQFEREVTAERIRDKIAASKKKGMWMGGVPPLGYDVENKLLVVNESEAHVVRDLFRLYLEIGSVRRLKLKADERGLQTKGYTYRDGRTVGGKPFSRGHLYALLSNPIYIGDVRHRGDRYPGQHKAIVDPAVWRSVQDLLASNAVRRKRSENVKETSLLTGLLYDETSDRLSPSHATKQGKRYRYYISHRLMQSHAEGQEGWRLPARELETMIVRALTDVLEDPQRIVDLATGDNPDPIQNRTIRTNAQDLANRLTKDHPVEQGECLRQVIVRINIRPGHLSIELNRQKMLQILECSDDTDSDRGDVPKPMTIDVPFTVRRRGVEARIVLDNGQLDQPHPDNNLIEAVAKAHDWFERMTSGRASSVQEIAATEGLARSDVSSALPLAFLAPDIVSAIVAGRQPIDLTWERLKRAVPLPSCWHRQRRVLGFSQPD